MHTTAIDTVDTNSSVETADDPGRTARPRAHRTRSARFLVAGIIAAAVALFGVGTAGAASGTTGPHSSGRVACISPGSTFAGGSNLKAGAPVMRAYNYNSTAVDRQTVTFQPVVFRWNGSAWAVYQYGKTLKGAATDSASPSVWYDASTNASWGAGTEAFTLPRGGYYAVAYQMNWYYSSPVSGNPATLSGSDYLWAAGYSLQSPIGAPTGTISYCTT